MQSCFVSVKLARSNISKLAEIPNSFQFKRKLSAGYSKRIGNVRSFKQESFSLLYESLDALWTVEELDVQFRNERIIFPNRSYLSIRFSWMEKLTRYERWLSYMKRDRTRSSSFCRNQRFIGKWRQKNRCCIASPLARQFIASVGARYSLANIALSMLRSSMNWSRGERKTAPINRKIFYHDRSIDRKWLLVVISGDRFLIVSGHRTSTISIE